MRELKVFFDYECPYCKKGHEYLLKLLKTNPDISVKWCPCEAHPRPENHPQHTDLCIQGYYYVKDTGGDVMAYHQRMYDALHTDKIDVEDSIALSKYAAGLVDEKKFLSALQDGTYKEIQEKGNDYAYGENGVWFLPAFRMGEGKLDAQGGIGVSEEELREFLSDAAVR